MKDLTEDEWRFVEWIDKEIRKADKHEQSILKKQLDYLRNDPMFTHPDESLLHPPFSSADALALGILETVYDQGVFNCIKNFKIYIPINDEYLKDLLLILPFYQIQYLYNFTHSQQT